MVDNDPTLARVIETLKEPVHIDPGFDGRVMAAIESQSAQTDDVSTPRRVTPWLRRRTIRLSPLGAFALAAALAAVVLAGSSIAGLRAGRATPTTASDDAAAVPAPTQFVLVAPAAKSVAVVGDFNDWNQAATPLVREAGDGVWWVTLPLPPGRYRYAFIVDGTTWRGDPNAPAADEEFGRPSSVVSIGGA